MIKDGNLSLKIRTSSPEPAEELKLVSLERLPTRCHGRLGKLPLCTTPPSQQHTDLFYHQFSFAKTSHDQTLSYELARTITKFVQATDEARLQDDPAYQYFIPSFLKASGLEVPDPLPIQGVGWASLLRSLEEDQQRLESWEMGRQLRRGYSNAQPLDAQEVPAEGDSKRPQVHFVDALHTAAKLCRKSPSEVQMEIEAFAERYHAPYSLRTIDELYDEGAFEELAVRLDRDRQYVRRHLLKGTLEQRESARRMEWIISVTRKRFF